MGETNIQWWVMVLSDGRVVHDDPIGTCPKSECGGDLVPVTGWGAWIDETCTRCKCSWCYQVPREISDIPTAADRERGRRLMLENAAAIG